MRIGEVTPQLFLGPAPVDPDDFRQLKKLNVTAIFSVEKADEGSGYEIEDERIGASIAGIKFTNLEVADFDRAELAMKLPECVKALETMVAAGDTVYLHCTAGVNRSPTVAVAYLHWNCGRPLDEALEAVSMCRNCVPDGEAVRLASRRRDKTTS
jgi:hypothetical protein